MAELADRIEGGQLGERTLRKMESGERALRPMELRTIAQACEVPYAFFTMPLEVLDVIDVAMPSAELLAREDIGSDPLLAVARAFEVYEHHLEDLTDDIPFEALGDPAESVHGLDRDLVAEVRYELDALRQIREEFVGTTSEIGTDLIGFADRMEAFVDALGGPDRAAAEKAAEELTAFTAQMSEKGSALVRHTTQPAEDDAPPAPADALLRSSEVDQPTTQSGRGPGGLRAVDSRRGKS